MNTGGLIVHFVRRGKGGRKIKKLFVVILVIYKICISANSSYSAQHWAKTHGLEDSWDDDSFIQRTTDGGYTVADFY